MDQVILTRFNLPSTGAESVVRSDATWLRDRVELFERYCLPSVTAQTDSRFTWLIYFDPASPAWLRRRIREHADAGFYAPVFRETVSIDDLLGDISARVGRRSDELVTTNLDNDDGLANDFVARLRAQPKPNRTTAYFVTKGLIKSTTGVYLRQDRHNAFPSVRAQWGTPATCWSDWHTRLGRRMPVVQIDGPPGWLQVVHGRNVSNRVRGRLVRTADYRPWFHDLLDGVPEPDVPEVLRDLVIGVPLRTARDLGRAVTKTTAQRVLGPAGFDRAKELLARTNRRRAALR